MDPNSIVDTLCAMDAEAAAQIISKLLEERPMLAPQLVADACPDLTFAPARAMTERRSHGVVKSYSEKSGFGFISCPELHEVFGLDVFLHAKQMGGLNVGDNVSFSVALKKDNKPQAYDVHAVSPTGELLPMTAPAAKEQQQGGWQGGSWGVATWNGAGGKGYGYKGDGYKGDGYKGGCGKGYGKKRSAEDLSQQQEIGHYTGTVKSFNLASGFGFIICPELQGQGYTNDVFLHREQINQCTIGQAVSFTAYLNSRGQPQARDCQPLDGSSMLTDGSVALGGNVATDGSVATAGEGGATAGW